MARPSTGKIDVTKIDKAHIFVGKTGKYLDFAIFENRDGADQYGNTHVIYQSVSKEARDRGEKGKIIGNITMIASEPQARRQPPARNSRPAASNEDEDIEF